MTEQKNNEVRRILSKYCSEFLNTQEITHAANEIIKNPTEETILEMTTYLDQFDTIRMGQSYLIPTTTVQGLTANNVRFAMSEIRALISQQEETTDEDEEPMEDNND